MLLIIDMQKGMQMTKLPPRNNPQAEANIALLLAHWRAAQMPVVHVRHLSREPASVFWPGQIGAEFQDALIPALSEHIVDKNVTDAFAHSGLEKWLLNHGVDKVIIAGVSTNISVEATTRSCASLGFKTVVVSDATFTFDRVDIAGAMKSAEELHLASLSNLSGEYACVLDTASVLRELETASN